MKMTRLTLCSLLTGAAMCVATGNLVAQVRSTTTETPGQSSVSTQVERAEVVYVSGNELVVRMENGEVKNLTVPDTATATVDGKTVTVHDLKPGMKLQRTITTTTTAKTVTTVKTVTGRVVQIIPPLTVVLSTPDGQHQYKIPKDQVFLINGEKKTAFDLRPGMEISATAVSSTPQVVSSEQRVVTGTAPPPPKPATPPPQTVLLIEEPAPAPPPVAAARPAPAAAPAPAPPPREPAPTKLPKTASPIPLIGLIGLLLFSASLGLRALRRQ